jgi:predicted nuclease of predicted toxin-antitoxin system
VAALLLDENVPRSTGTLLAQAGHEVAHVADTEPAASDRRVLAMARDAGRMLVTFDADFGDLIYQQGEVPPDAILFLRQHPIDSIAAASAVLLALSTPIAGQFVVCTREGLRHRPLPRHPPQPAPDRG